MNAEIVSRDIERRQQVQAVRDQSRCEIPIAVVAVGIRQELRIARADAERRAIANGVVPSDIEAVGRIKVGGVNGRGAEDGQCHKRNHGPAARKRRTHGLDLRPAGGRLVHRKVFCASR